MNQNLLAPPANDLPPPQSQPAPSSVFYPHGIWALGVKLMRNLNFGAKAILISLIFLLPLALTSSLLLKSLSNGITFAEDER